MKNTFLKIISIILATATWFYLADLVSQTTTFTVPVDLKLPEGLLQLNRSVNNVTLTLKGPSGVIEDLNVSDIHCYKELEPDTQPGNLSIPVQDLNITVPRQIKIENVFPPRINLRIDRIVEKDFKVRVITRGKPATGYIELDTHRVNPTVMKLRGPEQIIASVDTVNTEPIDISGLIASKRFTSVKLQEFLPHHPLNEDKYVEVTIRIAEETSSRTFQKLPIRVLELVKTPFSIAINQLEGDVTVRGKAELLNQLNAPDIKIFCDVTNLDAGEYDLPVEGVLPDKFLRDGARIISISPSSVEVTISVKQKEQF